MIEIWDGPTVHPGNLLDPIVRTGELHWSVMELWAVARDDDTDVIALERQAAKSATGLQVTADQLWELADRLAQLIDAIVVGYRGAPPVRSDTDLRESVEIVIEAIDSTLWRVYAQDPAVIDRLRREFDDVRDVMPEVPIPAAHEQS
jgi:hypothetical protein